MNIVVRPSRNTTRKPIHCFNGFFINGPYRIHSYHSTAEDKARKQCTGWRKKKLLTSLATVPPSIKHFFLTYSYLYSYSWNEIVKHHVVSHRPSGKLSVPSIRTRALRANTRGCAGACPFQNNSAVLFENGSD